MAESDPKVRIAFNFGDGQVPNPPRTRQTLHDIDPFAMSPNLERSQTPVFPLGEISDEEDRDEIDERPLLNNNVIGITIRGDNSDEDGEFEGEEF